jgi:dCMP deaminase
MTVTEWHLRFADMAALVSKWSKDPSTQVGAVIVRDRMVLSTGYNGLPRGVDDLKDRLHNRDFKYPMTVHAEMNAILQATASLQGAVLYVTHHPCADCAGPIIQAGIKKIVIKTPQKGLAPNWDEKTKIARIMFYEADVSLINLAEIEANEEPFLQAAE